MVAANSALQLQCVGNTNQHYFNTLEAGKLALRILYVGTFGPTDTSRHRYLAIKRLGHHVCEFDTTPYLEAGGSLSRAVRGHLLIGWTIHRLNMDLIEAASSNDLDVIWFDKASYVRPETLRKLRAMGRYTVHFNIDNPFGPRKDPGWRLIIASVPEYDLHLVQRDINLTDYRRAGARDVQIMRTAYEPTLHYPPPDNWSDRDRQYDTVFIGSPYDDRPKFLMDLCRRFDIKVAIWGGRWEYALPEPYRSQLRRGGPIYNDQYRQTIWRSRICLSFITHSNCDDVAHRSFEITASGGFMIAEDTPGHRAHFAAGKEVEFFDSLESCAALIKKYLPDEPSRTEIAKAGYRRSLESGYSNDGRIRGALDYVERQLKLPLSARGRQ